MELTPNDLSKIKSIELKMFEAFITVCETLNLTYFVIGGTLLGAIRHKGFIPWDEDIDIGMPREDYEIFVNKGQLYLPEYYFLQTKQSDPEYFIHYCKIRDNRTTFVEKTIKHLKINHGVFIDIFPFDFSNTKHLGRRLHCLRLIEGRYLKNYTMRQKIKSLIASFLTMTFTINSAYKKIEKIFKRYNNGKYLVNYSGIYSEREFADADLFSKTTKLPFENMIVMAPVGYEKYLTGIYGNFMELPPIEKRTPHHYVEKVELIDVE